MVGYRIYFDGEKFTMDDHKSQVGNTPVDGVVHWNAGYDTAIQAVENQNNHLKKNIEDLRDDKDFVVKNCKDCGNFYIITKIYADWFLERKLKVPCRCDLCRMRRKYNNRKSEDVQTGKSGV